MTCDTARILLLFYRPGRPSPDLAAEDVAALEAHLAGCPACSAAAGLQTAVDSAIARAFRQVDVPGGLHDRLRFDAEARAGRLWRAKWLTRATVAAIVACLGLTGWGVHAATRPPLDIWGVADQADAVYDRPEQTARDWLAAEGIPPPLPEDFDYRYLTNLGYAKVRGELVPVMEFRVNGAGFARVYFIRPHQFAVKDAAETQNSTVTVRLYKDRPAPGWTVMVVHTGNGLQPFLRPPVPQQ